MPITVPPIPTPVPQSTDPLNFDARADAVMSSLPGVVTAQNAQNDENNTINTNVNAQRLAAGISESAASLSAIAAASSANFRGAWSALTGVLNVPASVLHNGQIWQLLTNQSNVATAVPGVSAAWYPVVGIDVASRAPIAPTLDLDFARQRYSMYDSAAGGLSSVALASILTYTGANRTFTDAMGILRVQASNVPRLEFDPVTGAGNGLSVFEARTNLVINSEDFNAASWGKSNLNISVNNALSPSGNNTADSVAANSVNQSHFLTSPTFSSTSGTSYTQSVFAKRLGTAGYRLRLRFNVASFGSIITADFDLQSGVVVFSHSQVTASIVSVGNGWFRCSVTATATASATSDTLILIVSELGSQILPGDDVSGAILWGAQLEVGASPTPYIPTTTAAVTAPGDLASLTGTNFSKWFNPVEGTFVAIATPSVSNNFGSVFTAGNGTSANAIRSIFWNDGNVRGLIVEVAAVAQAQLVSGTYAAGIAARISSSYRENDFSASYNGGAPITDTSGTVPVVDRLFLGVAANGLAFPLNGTISRILYFPRALPANLQQLSA